MQRFYVACCRQEYAIAVGTDEAKHRIAVGPRDLGVLALGEQLYELLLRWHAPSIAPPYVRYVVFGVHDARLVGIFFLGVVQIHVPINIAEAEETAIVCGTCRTYIAVGPHDAQT